MDTFSIDYQIDSYDLHVGKQIMLGIQLDSDMITRYDKAKYPKKWLYPIAICAKRFLDAYPTVLHSEFIEQLTGGDDVDKYLDLPEFRLLDHVLDEYFIEIV